MKRNLMTTTTSVKKRLYAGILFISVIVSQLANIIYEKLMHGEDISVTIFPSLLFLSLLTIPSLVIGFKLSDSMGLSLYKPHLSYSKETGYNPILFAVVSSLLLGGFVTGCKVFHCAVFTRGNTAVWISWSSRGAVSLNRCSDRRRSLV